MTATAPTFEVGMAWNDRAQSLDRLRVSFPLKREGDAESHARRASDWVGHLVLLSGKPHLVEKVVMGDHVVTASFLRCDGNALTRFVSKEHKRVMVCSPYSPLPDGPLVRALSAASLRPMPFPHYAGFVRYESALTLWRGPVGRIARWWYRGKGEA